MNTNIQTKNVYEIFKKNPLLWGFYYFPHHFRSKTPQFHVKILKEVMGNRYFACQCPRESAKSTILAFLYPEHGVVFQKFRFIVIVQNTYLKASQSLETIKSELRNNKHLRDDFMIDISKDSTGDSVFTHPNGFQTRILCKGAEQIGSVRGEKFGAYRPDLILIDDLEDDDMVRSPERRRNVKDLYDNALVPAGDAENCQYIAIGTILHDDCLMAKLVSPSFYPEYRKLFYRALYKDKKNGEWRSLWDEKWSVKKLFNLRKEKPDVFAKEYQGNPVSGGLRKFDKEDFRYWYVEEDHYVLLDSEGRIKSKGALASCRAAIGCDLAWEERKEADYTVIMPGFLTCNSELLIETYFCERGVRPDQFEEVLFNIEQRLRQITGKTVYIGFEKAKLEKVTKWFLTQAMKRRNYWLNLKDVAWETDKISRIVTPLQPRYKLHSIFHKRGMGELEYQLLRIPSGAHDDLPDAEQILCRLLEYSPSARKKSVSSEDPHFEWLRNNHIKKSKGREKKAKIPFVFGKKSVKLREIPAKESWR